MEINSKTSFIRLLLFLTCVTKVNLTVKKPKLIPYSLPDNRRLKEDLGYKEDTYLNFTELATKYKYNSEQHTVKTEDGYILTAFKINSKCNRVNPYPVLLFHGLFDSSDLWIIEGPGKALGYVLSDNCYDVWAVNHRGNYYSRKHVKLNPDTDKDYWNYSFDEHGNYDLPAFVDYILEVSKRPKLFFIGHSQGTTNFFVTNSLRPEYNEKFALSIHLAPVAWLRHISSLISIIAAQGTEAIKTLFESAGYYELFAKDHISHFVVEFLCQSIPELVCGNVLALTSGYKQGTIYSKTLSVAFGHLLVGTSTKDLAHFGQLILSKKFQRYDEGKRGNLRRYGTIRPPEYDVLRITSPVVLINAYHDWIATVKDANILAERLPNLVENYIVPRKYWSHHNHLYGIKAPTYVYPKILEYFETYSTRI